MDTIGQRIAYAMKLKGISNIDMADYLGVNASYIAKFKTDARRPNTFQIDKIAQKLDVTTDYLLGIEDTGLPYYVDILNENEKQGISLMNNINYRKHFSTHSKWNSIAGIQKDDLLVFQRVIDNDNIINNKVYIVVYNDSEVALGRIVDNLLFFDNGLPPVDISNKDRYKVVGKLIRSVRYFN
jgi:transcriptional regulator with XRE-family HTH domain